MVGRRRLDASDDGVRLWFQHVDGLDRPLENKVCLQIDHKADRDEPSGRAQAGDGKRDSVYL